MSTAFAIFRLTLIIASTAFTLGMAITQGPNDVVVISVVGDWTYHNSAVSFGKHLPTDRDGFVRGSDGSIVLQYGEKQEVFACEKLPPNEDHCSAPLDASKWKPSGQGFRNFWAAVERFICGDPQKYMVAASRGAEEGLTAGSNFYGEGRSCELNDRGQFTMKNYLSFGEVAETLRASPRSNDQRQS
jgi:hypothetical protein